jgi:hypothetical protein
MIQPDSFFGMETCVVLVFCGRNLHSREIVISIFFREHANFFVYKMKKRF